MAGFQPGPDIFLGEGEARPALPEMFVDGWCLVINSAERNACGHARSRSFVPVLA